MLINQKRTKLKKELNLNFEFVCKTVMRKKENKVIKKNWKVEAPSDDKHYQWAFRFKI